MVTPKRKSVNSTAADESVADLVGPKIKRAKKAAGTEGVPLVENEPAVAEIKIKV